MFNPIRSGVFETDNDPHTTANDPPTISKTIVSIFTISCVCILLGVLSMFQYELDFFQNFAILTIYSDFKSKLAKQSFCLKGISNTPKDAEF